MRRMLLVCVGMLALLAWRAAIAGETLACFNRGDLGSCSERVLTHVAFKSVVLQFVDPDETGLGEGMARILWREILESIYDLPDAGVILAYDRVGEIEEALGEEDLGVFLQREYHDAARAIAAQQEAQMGIWGAILRDGEELYTQTFLTLRQPEDDHWTTLTLAIQRPGDVRLSTVLGRDRINMPPLRKRRADLFERSFTTRCRLSSGCPRGVELRDGPSNDARIVAQVPAGSRVEVVDMQRQWLKLRTAADTERWINLFHVEMFPEVVTFFSRNNVNLRAEPGGEKIGRVNLDGRFDVINAARHGRFDQPWYQIEVDSRLGWVAGHLANRRSYMFPGVHLIAGLYRYGRGQYDRAVIEFEAFIEETPADDNVTRAVALKFLAASRLADENVRSARVADALEDLDAAVELTPFDSSNYTMRALVRAGSGERLGLAIDDLSRALELNRRDPGAVRLLESMSAASEDVGLYVFAPGHVNPRLERQFESLELKYLHDRPL